MLVLKSVNFEQQQFQNHHLKQFYSGQMEWIIGRSISCDLVLASPEVSRVHGRIICSDDAYYFVDVGSTSGSLLNGNSVTADDKCKLQIGDLLQLGETFLFVEELVPASATLSAPNAIAQLPFLHPEQEWAESDLLCRCCRIVQETHDVKTFYFVAEPAVLFSYFPGQFVNLEVEIDGKPVIRSYSISSSPTRPYHLSMTVKRVASPPDQPEIPAGVVSNWLHDQFRVGDRVKLLGGPLGQFTCLPDLPSKLLLISAGSGITPMISMLRWVQDTLVNCDIVFLYSARTSEDIVFRAELEAIATQMPNFRLAVTVTKQPIERPWMGLTGRISESMLNLVVPDLLERAAYVCGPDSFMEATRSLLSAMQFPMQNYKEESFGRKSFAPKAAPPVTIIPSAVASQASSNGHGHGAGDRARAFGIPETRDEVAHPPAKSVPTATSPATVQFVKSERTIPIDEQASILEIAEQAGISIRHACRVGACGACKIRVHTGEVQYETPPAALSASDRQNGYALACVGYATASLAIEA